MRFSLRIKRSVLLVFTLLLAGQLLAQQGVQVRGVVADGNGVGLSGALVTLQSSSRKLFAVADGQGNFSFIHIKDSSIALSFTSLGFDSLRQNFTINPKLAVNQLDTIQLGGTSNSLGDVVVDASPQVSLKEDTVQYNASSFKVREGDAVEEMVKKLPGMEVDKDGNVSVDGEPITSIRLDGKDYFGDDVAAAIQNLPADIVKNLQVIDDYGEEAKETGLKSGESKKVLNINLKPDKKVGYFARLQAGGGTEGRYLGRARGNYLNGDAQYSLDLNVNNNKSWSPGVNVNKSVKANYRDKWGEKIESYGSYRYRDNDNHTTVKSSSQNFFPEYTRYEDKNTDNRDNGKQHRFDWNLEYRPDTNNYLKVQPNISYATSRSNSKEHSLTQLEGASSVRDNLEQSTGKSSQLGMELFYNHKFKKYRRNLNLGFTIMNSLNDNSRHIQNDYVNTDADGSSMMEQQYQRAQNKDQNLHMEAKAAYLEPLSSISFLELAYRLNRTANDIYKNTLDIDPANGTETINANLSNDYDYNFTTQRVGINYKLKSEKINSTLGLFAQPSLLSGIDHSRNLKTYQSHFNWVPSFRFSYRFSKEKRLKINYNGNSNQPGFAQLQPVTDNSNLQSTITGNPDLRPEFVHRAKIEYRQADTRTGRALYARLNFEKVQDKIVTSKNIIEDSIKQEITYANVNGGYSASGNYAVDLPFNDRKFVFSYFGGADYTRNISLTNHAQIIGKNVGIRQGLKFRLDLKDIVDTEIKTSYAHANAKFSAGSIDDRSSSQVNIRLEGRNYFFKDFTLGYDLSKTFNSGYNSSIGDPTFLSVYVERRFLKNNQATIRLQGFDLFGQNTGIQRDIFDNEIIDSESNRLSTYFMLSFNYRLQSFGG